MEVRLIDVMKLLEALSEYTGEAMNYSGFGRIEDMSNGLIRQKYLYDNIWRESQQVMREGGDTLNLNESNLDLIAKFLNYRSFRSFVKDSTLVIREDILGIYYVYIRKNAVKTEILRSPVRIDNHDSSMRLTLLGKDRIFTGEVKIQDGCLTVFMTSDDQKKSFYHVYRIGSLLMPHVMCGIFSGVSSFHEPIGGRCVLIRQNVDFSVMTAQKFSYEELSTDHSVVIQQLAEYLNKYEFNNLRLNEPFELDR